MREMKPRRANIASFFTEDKPCPPTPHWLYCRGRERPPVARRRERRHALLSICGSNHAHGRSRCGSGDIALRTDLVKDGTHLAVSGAQRRSEHETTEVGGDFVVRVEREHVRNILVWTNDDHRPTLAIDAAEVEDVWAVLEVGRVGFLVVDKPEPPLARKQYRRQLFDLKLAVPLLKYRANVDDAIDVLPLRGKPSDR